MPSRARRIRWRPWVARIESSGATAKPAIWLAAAAAVEALALAALYTAGNERFLQIVSSDDSAGYLAVARALMHGQLVASPRTLGYPLYLATCGVIDPSLHLAIAGQLAVNLAVTVAVFRLAGRILDGAGVRARLVVAALAFVAGFGLALALLTDFLAGACFFGSLYGLLSWRRRRGQLASAALLAAATLLRPTFTLLPLLLPLIAWLVARVTTAVPRRQLVGMMLASLAATSLSVAYQYRSYRYVGPSSVVTFNLEATLHHALAPQQPFDVYRRQLDATIARDADTDAPSPSVAEHFARARFAAALAEHPRAIVLATATTALKYLLAPVEALPATLARIDRAPRTSDAYEHRLRPLLFLVWLPVWLLAYIPVVGGDRRARAFYLLVMLLVVYVIGLSSLAPLQGERMRYPLVPLLVVLAAARVHDWRRRRRTS